jgi:riboflavin kinase/FMN adenylyltransferase
LYGAPIAVDFVARIRGQVRFEGVGALIVQIQDDVRRCHQILGA